jgi:hypothetical protein
MTSKDYVKRYYPKAKAERQKQNNGDVYWLIRDGNAYLYIASGKTESNAWVNAKEKIEMQSVKEMEEK